MKTEEEIKAEIEKLWKAWANPHLSGESIMRLSYALSALKWALGEYNGDSLSGILGLGGLHE